MAGAGIASAIALGCAFAAVDLWGGPRALGIRPRGLAAMIVACAIAILAGAIGWIRSFPREQRLRRGLVALALLAAVGSLSGAGLFAYYAARLEPSDRICLRAQCELVSSERQRILNEGLGPLFPVIDPGSKCLLLERERREWETRRTCPLVPLSDQPCDCARERWDGTSRCGTGLTTCEYRADLGETKLGCAAARTAERLIVCSDEPPPRAARRDRSPSFVVRDLLALEHEISND